MRLPLPIIIAGLVIATAVMLVINVSVLPLPYVGMGNFTAAVTNITAFHAGWGKIDFVSNASITVYSGPLPILYAVYFPNGTLVNASTPYGEIWAFKNGPVCGFVNYQLEYFYVEFVRSNSNPNLYVATFVTGTMPSLQCGTFLFNVPGRGIEGSNTLYTIAANTTHVVLGVYSANGVNYVAYKAVNLVGSGTTVSVTGLLPKQYAVNGVEVVAYPTNIFVIQPSAKAQIIAYPRK
ncbi:MAG: hypothetical protein QXS16_04485 [Pyrobaculum sp.]